MTTFFNDETYNQLARHLATENLRIIIGEYHTASIDVRNRIVFLPLWRELDPTVATLLRSHECAHALWSPYEGLHSTLEANSSRPGYKSFLNVVEDARIERLLKTKFPGLRVDYRKGYKILWDECKFGATSFEEVNNYLLIDRLNIKAKLSVDEVILRDSVEAGFYIEMMSTNTWEEVVDLTDRLYDYCRGELLNPVEGLGDFGYGDSPSEGVEGEEGEPNNGEGQDDKDGPANPNDAEDDITSKTDNAFNESTGRDKSVYTSDRTCNTVSSKVHTDEIFYASKLKYSKIMFTDDLGDDKDDDDEEY